ncbi:hypothetical protein FOA52_004940 [Chlamydomonas sp. UWO 241]|nr:hypothetical protein FOA52_004940 [Chlamydomonas sp. UWO 241]
MGETGASTSTSDGTRVSEDNFRRLQLDNPALAAEGPLWVHETARPEKGGLVIATSKTSTILGDRLEQAVVFLIEHGDQGSIGVILNRPTGMVLGRGKKSNGMPFELTNAPSSVQQSFADNRLYCGGFTAQHVIHVVHGHGGLEGAIEIVPGIFTGGEVAASAAVADGDHIAEDFRFHAGAVVWDRGELDAQAAQGAWYPAACARAVVLKQCIQLPTPLWREVLMLMGGEYKDVADEDFY